MPGSTVETSHWVTYLVETSHWVTYLFEPWDAKKALATKLWVAPPPPPAGAGWGQGGTPQKDCVGDVGYNQRRPHTSDWFSLCGRRCTQRTDFTIIWRHPFVPPYSVGCLHNLCLHNMCLHNANKVPKLKLLSKSSYVKFPKLKCQS